MKNHPCDDHETDEEEPEMTPESTAEQEDLRLAEFRARCARMRENTERELARLAQHRADVRVQIGITSATMEQWKLEHQQMLRDSQQ